MRTLFKKHVASSLILGTCLCLSGCATISQSAEAPRGSAFPGAAAHANDSRHGRPATGRAPHTSGSAKITADTPPGLSRSWPLFGNNAWQDRYSPIGAISAHTISGLRMAYDIALPNMHGGNESYPEEQNGVLYITGSNASVYAIDVKTGAVRWSYTPAQGDTYGLPQINRGVAMGRTRLYVLTAEDKLLALRKSDGRLLYAVQVAKPQTGIFESMAPLIAGHAIIVGSSGGDEGVRGFIAAYSRSNGHFLWRFYTVPQRGVNWLPKTGHHGGGAVWTTPTYNPASGLIYFGSGNPSPDYYGAARPGPNPYTDAVVCIQANTGALHWYRQEVPHDLWDYDVASPPLIFMQGSQLRVAEAGKDGYLYEWNASNGRPVTKPVAFVKEDHVAPTPAGNLEWPGPDGGANYGPSAYDPETADIYVAGINGPETLYASPQQHSGHTLDLGTAQSPASRSHFTGTITAIHAGTGTIAWQIATPAPPIGGVTATAGGVLFFGLANGVLEGVAASSGHVLWRRDTGVPIGAAPIVFASGQTVFVAVALGGAASLSTLFPYSGLQRLLVYRLNPKATTLRERSHASIPRG